MWFTMGEHAGLPLQPLRDRIFLESPEVEVHSERSRRMANYTVIEDK